MAEEITPAVVEEKPLIAPELGGDKDIAPAPIEAPTKGMHEMDAKERREFLDTGKAPKAAKTDGKTSDSSTDPAKGQKAAEIAATEKAKPASEPGDPTKDKKARNSEESRVIELLDRTKREAERADRAERLGDDLRKRLEALEAGSKPKADAKTDSSTAAKPSTSKIDPKRLGADGIPDIGKYAENELNQFFADLHQAGREQAQAEIDARFGERETQAGKQAELHQEMERVVTQAVTRLEADEKAHPDLIEKVHPNLRNLKPLRMLADGDKPHVDHLIKDNITFESDHPLQLSAYYSTDEGWKEWVAMRDMDRRSIERTIARRDLAFDTSSSAATATEPKPVAKTRTSAAPPPDKTGPKSASTADEAESAVKAGDFDALVKALDEKEGTQTRRWGRRR